MGAGKTIIALTALQELIQDGILNTVVVFAPLKVCEEQWRQEAAAWKHIMLDVTFCTGTPAERVAIVEGCTRGVLLVNFDIMAWFCDTFPKFGDGLLIDELSKLKAGGKGFKRLRRTLDHYKWRAGMTGTPVAEDFEGLFYQVLAIDCGKALGRNKTKYLERHFSPDYNGYDWTLHDGEGIVRAVHHLIHTVPDYTHELPPLNVMPLVVEMNEAGRKAYDAFAKDLTIELGGHTQVADSPAVLSGKLQQLASGAIYVYDEWEEKIGVERLHNVKVEKCQQLVATLNEPVVIAYWYQHELERLVEAFPEAVNLSESGAMQRWNNGEIDILLVQPQSCSHGIQLQFGGCKLIFVGLVWSNDISTQMVRRLWRRGQTEPVDVWEIVSKGTVDEDMIDRVAGKKHWNAALHKMLAPAP